jgi:molecular chaperone GrpE (heat shock protein)
MPDAGLLQVVETLTAMRHELKLQTRNGRSLEESLQGARQSLDAAMRQFQSVQAREEESARRAAQPLVEALVGLDESLERGTRALEITHRQLTVVAPQELRQALDDQFRQLPWWRRWILRARHERTRDHVTAAMTHVNTAELTRLTEGYQLIHSRLQQELQKQGVRRVVTVGQRVDPTCMTVVDVDDDDQLPPETVSAELRPGYVWRQTVIRFAEVRAVKNRVSVAPDFDEEAQLYLLND